MLGQQLDILVEVKLPYLLHIHTVDILFVHINISFKTHNEGTCAFKDS